MPGAAVLASQGHWSLQWVRNDMNWPFTPWRHRKQPRSFRNILKSPTKLAKWWTRCLTKAPGSLDSKLATSRAELLPPLVSLRGLGRTATGTAKGNSLEFIDVCPIHPTTAVVHGLLGIYIQLGGLKEHSCEDISRDGFSTWFEAQPYKVAGFFWAVSCLDIANRYSENLLPTILFHTCRCETSVLLLPLLSGFAFASWQSAAKRTWLHPVAEAYLLCM